MNEGSRQAGGLPGDLFIHSYSGEAMNERRRQAGGSGVSPEISLSIPTLVTVGAVNWKGVWGDKSANLEKMKAKIREAARLGIDMLCFPELALTGYECSDEASSRQGPCALHAEGAETIPGPSTKEIAGLARELGIYVILGMPERDASDPRTLYISAAVVGPEGILGSYRKLHLATPPTWTEYYCFKPG
ncbi:MAG: carbon-nitrogen hydrolase family protein, partial [Dehalococcoidia bacterium]|nr:carbon-nitrogen hydrolase family protein [Dehalococcoidia bacterium]